VGGHSSYYDKCGTALNNNKKDITGLNIFGSPTACLHYFYFFLSLEHFFKLFFLVNFFFQKYGKA